MPVFDKFYGFIGGETDVVSNKRLAPGKATIVFDFVYDGGGAGKGAPALCS